MKKEDLILGKNYVIKPQEWFDENGLKSPGASKCGDSFALIEIGREQVTLWKKGDFSFTVLLIGIEPDPNDKREISNEAKKLAENIKRKFQFLYTSRNCTGAGRGRVVKTSDMEIVHCFSDGEECLQLPGGDSIPAKWSLEQIKDLLKGKEISRSFSVTDHTSCTLEAKLGNKEEELKGAYSWSSGPW